MADLYWHVGDMLHQRIEADGWAKGTVVQLAAFIAQREPGLRGFSAQNLWRMRQFFLAYSGLPDLSTLLRALPWSSHLHILSRSKRAEEREFYLRMATQHRWQVREVARQIDSGLFERAVPDPPKLSRLPDKQMLVAKLPKFYALTAPAANASAKTAARRMKQSPMSP